DLAHGRHGDSGLAAPRHLDVPALPTGVQAMSGQQSSNLRSVSRVVPARKTLEGEGFEVRRPIPAAGLEAIGPFLFLDHFGPVDLGPGEAKGAPNHPHRGFETL